MLPNALTNRFIGAPQPWQQNPPMQDAPPVWGGQMPVQPSPIINPAQPPWQAPGAPMQPVGGPVGFQAPPGQLPMQGQPPAMPPQQVPNIYSQMLRPRMTF